VHFALLRSDAEGEYISHSTWESREAFVAWTQSEAFVQGHRQGGSLMGVLQGPPAVKLFEAVLEQDFAK
jgi:heme-degrading monooxygenase HmoA